MNVLNIQNLSKAYGRIKALDNLNLSIEAGTIYGLLGPNGSGKTTTLGIILGILSQDKGDYTWFEGQYGNNHRMKIGSILETPNFYPYLNADENLGIVAHLKNVEKPLFEDVLTLVKLKDRRKYPFSTYSLGMKQRLAIAATLIGDPEVLIFDEPTNGLDPEGIAEIRNILIEVSARGKTVIMASHLLDEVEKICTHVAIIKKGKLLANGPIGTIINNDLTVEIGVSNLPYLNEYISRLSYVHTVVINPQSIEITIPHDFPYYRINSDLVNAGFEISHFVARKRKLETEFLLLTK